MAKSDDKTLRAAVADHTYLKAFAAHEGISIKQLISDLVSRHMVREFHDRDRGDSEK